MQVALSLYYSKKWMFEKLKLMLDYITRLYNCFLAGKYFMPSFMYFGVKKKMEPIFCALSSAVLEKLGDE